MAECICDIATGLLEPGVFNIKQFTNGTETMVWTVSSRYLEGSNIDLGNYDAFLVLSANGLIDEVILTKINKSDTIQLIWNIGEWATKLKGHVIYQIVFRSANFDKLGVISDNTDSKGVYGLVDGNTTGNERVFLNAKSSYSIKWDSGNSRWALYGEDGSTIIDYQTIVDTEPHCGAWGDIAVGNLESAVWHSAEAIMYVSESIVADQNITANFPTILRQLWNKITKSGVTSVNNMTGIVEISASDIGAAEENHKHDIADINSLSTKLGEKANATHTHSISDVMDLSNTLSKKANSTHTHAIADTTGLQDALNNRSQVGHTHAMDTITGLNNALNSKAPSSHTSTVATTSTLGHVKIDGKTIQIDSNGVIKAIGGRGIGEIFAYPSALPPEGAYLLNGQTITNCRELYPEFWEWVNNSGVRSIGNNTYEAEIAEYGMCDAFVISGSDVRLPTWNGYQTPLGDSVPVIGNGLTMGLTDGANTYGLRMYTPGISARSNSIAGETLVGTKVGDSGDMLRDKYAVGLSTDPTKSGIIVDTSGLYPDRWSWVIQVFNTATDLSNQESAQLASQMQMKAQKDLGNVDSNIDFVVDSYDDGQGNWYRVYRSGWVEQGGYVSNSNPNTLITTTFLKSFNNVNYCLNITSDRSSSSTTAIEIRELGYIEKNTTFFTKYLAGKTNYEEGFNWYACGQGEN